jgi:hypothetical protein
LREDDLVEVGLRQPELCDDGAHFTFSSAVFAA